MRENYTEKNQDRLADDLAALLVKGYEISSEYGPTSGLAAEGCRFIHLGNASEG
ncbi:MAG: hypothetical protein HYY05_07695 [Chloroflexi bacterium]|nr:hypothetical protein [Chloroflexota bacterium]